MTAIGSGRWARQRVPVASAQRRILQRLGMHRLPASHRYKRHQRRWKRYEKQRPGHQLQVDVKFIGPLGQPGRMWKYYQ